MGKIWWFCILRARYRRLGGFGISGHTMSWQYFAFFLDLNYNRVFNTSDLLLIVVYISINDSININITFIIRLHFMGLWWLFNFEKQKIGREWAWLVSRHLEMGKPCVISNIWLVSEATTYHGHEIDVDVDIGLHIFRHQMLRYAMMDGHKHDFPISCQEFGGRHGWLCTQSSWNTCHDDPSLLDYTAKEGAKLNGFGKRCTCAAFVPDHKHIDSCLWSEPIMSRTLPCTLRPSL